MIIIIGAGIAGLSLGYELVKGGADVTVLEAGAIASGASGVATSYLEPRLGQTAMRRVEWEGLARWGGYAEEITDVSGIDVGFRREGQVRVTIGENHDKFEKDLTMRSEQGWEFGRLTPAEVLQKEPSLSPGVVAGAFLPGVRWLNGAKLCAALAACIRKMGGQIIENSPVREILYEGDHTQIVTQRGDFFDAEKVVLCTGLTGRAIKGVPDDIGESRPVRGVNFVLDMSEHPHPVRHLVKHHRGNLCPRIDEQGRSTLIVGTTYEPGQTSPDVGDDVVEKLYGNAEPVFPDIRSLPLIKVTAGLRSKIDDGTLKLGNSAHQPNVYFSLSHAGAGYLRAPVVADEFAEFILTGEKGELTGFVTVN